VVSVTWNIFMLRVVCRNESFMSIPGVHGAEIGNHFLARENGFCGDSPRRMQVHIWKESFKPSRNSRRNKNKFSRREENGRESFMLPRAADPTRSHDHTITRSHDHTITRSHDHTITRSHDTHDTRCVSHKWMHGKSMSRSLRSPLE
jgi:hypothetical protein